MTDYLEELLEGADALREQLRRLERLSASGQEEGVEETPSAPELRRAGQRAEEAGDCEAEPSQERENAPPPQFGGIVEEDTAPVGQKGELSPVERGAESQNPGKVEGEDRGEAESSPLLEELERLERASAALEGGGLAPQEQSSFQGGSGTGSEYPMVLSKTGGGGFGWVTEEPAGWNWRSALDSAADSSGGELSLAEQTDQAFRRDSRRYDGGFFLY